MNLELLTNIWMNIQDSRPDPIPMRRTYTRKTRSPPDLKHSPQPGAASASSSSSRHSNPSSTYSSRTRLRWSPEDTPASRHPPRFTSASSRSSRQCGGKFTLSFVSPSSFRHPLALITISYQYYQTIMSARSHGPESRKAPVSRSLGCPSQPDHPKLPNRPGVGARGVNGEAGQPEASRLTMRLAWLGQFFTHRPHPWQSRTLALPPSSFLSSKAQTSTQVAHPWHLSGSTTER